MSYQICPGTPEDRAEIHARLQAYNARYITDCAEFSLCVRDERGELLGGLAATRDLDCVTVDYLFVAEGARGQGRGAALLDRAEDEARRRGARRMLLNTFSFQAPGFYDRQGYRRFGGVSPCLGEYGQYFYVKELQNNPPQSPGQG